MKLTHTVVKSATSMMNSLVKLNKLLKRKVFCLFTFQDELSVKQVSED